MKRNKKNQSTRITWIGGIITMLCVGLYFLYSTYAKPADINKIAIDNPNGCYFRQVQCVKEPCEPVLYCPPPKPSTEFCALVAGKCTSKSGACVTYADGCERATKCKQPVDTESCGDTVKPEPSVGSSCICPPGAACKLPPSCNTPTPVPTPPPTTGVLYFVAKEPCGLNSFKNIVYDCTGAGSKSYSNGACTNIIQAMKAIQSLCAGGRKLE